MASLNAKDVKRTERASLVGDPAREDVEELVPGRVDAAQILSHHVVVVAAGSWALAQCLQHASKTYMVNLDLPPESLVHEKTPWLKTNL